MVLTGLPDNARIRELCARHRLLADWVRRRPVPPQRQCSTRPPPAEDLALWLTVRVVLPHNAGQPHDCAGHFQHLQLRKSACACLHGRAVSGDDRAEALGAPQTHMSLHQYVAEHMAPQPADRSGKESLYHFGCDDCCACFGVQR